MGGLFPRTLSTALPRVAGPYPVVYLTGPRQSGKTTLACGTFPDFAYVNLEGLQRRVLSRAACSRARDHDSALSLATMDVAWASEYEARVIETVPWGAPPRETRGRPPASEGGSP